MLQFCAQSFYNAIVKLTEIVFFLSLFSLEEKNKKGSEPILIRDKETKDGLYHFMGEVFQAISVLDAPVTRKALLEFKTEIESDNEKAWALDTLMFRVDEIRNTLRRELESVTLLALSSREGGFFDPKPPLFGAVFDDRFKSDAVFEVDEASKCFALGRPTACVFHLMRAMEVGIRATARCLQISDPIKPAERNWGFILRSLRVGIDAKWPNMTERASGDGALFEDLYVSLDAVKNPWRNATMHVEKKYTNDEAEHILIAVKGFMKKLANRMDENGEPFA